MTQEPSISPERKSNSISNKVVDIGTARFADRLAPEHEQAWDELVIASRDTGLTVEELMTPVWLDESIPHAFRDRAMLLVSWVNSGRESLPTNGKFFFSGVSIASYLKVVPSFDPALFCTWVHDARAYQQENDSHLIDKLSDLRWEYEFFERGMIGKEALDSFVCSINIAASSPSWTGGGWGEESYPLDENRFPIIDDILNSRTVQHDATEVREWALGHLQNWLAYQADGIIEIPDWLKAVPAETGRQLYRNLINDGDKRAYLTWGAVHSAVRVFGLRIFSRSGGEVDLRTVHTIDDPTLKQELLKAVLAAQNEAATSDGKYYPILGTSYSNGAGSNIEARDIIDEVMAITNDPELEELLALEVEHAEQYKERERQRQEQRSREYDAQLQASPEHQAKQRAIEAFLARVAQLPGKKQP